MEKILNYINGVLVEPINGSYLDNYNPAIGKVYSQIPDSNEKDIDLAYNAANDAFLGWSATPKEERSKIMMRIADLIEENLVRYD